MHRRRFLMTGVALAVAGCSGGDGTGGTSRGGATDGGTGTDAAETLDTHPAARNPSSQPRHGPEPGQATATIVVFEDPSCPTCARFEREVVPNIMTELVEPGTVSFVFRGYPVIYSWGEPATRALEAVYARNAEAHWTLAAHYFENQGDYRGSEPAGVFDRTETFLAAETGVDATAAMDAASDGEADAAVETDLAAGRDAGAGRTTPHLFLFRDGAFRTKSAGYTGLETIKGVLGV